MATITPSKKKSRPTTPDEVLTLTEAANYLRVTEEDVLEAVRRQQLPGRKVREEWRFLKSALHDWLRTPANQKDELLRLTGAWKDDPYLDEMLDRIYKDRGRPMLEETAR